MDLKVKIAGVEFQNPIMTASGTFSHDMEQYFDFDEIGAVTLKGIYSDEKMGNKAPRIAEVTGGILNAVGLPGIGVSRFINEILPEFKKYKKVKVIANVCGNSVEEYAEVVDKIGDRVDMFEINVSCPNVKSGCMAFGTSVDGVKQVVKAVKRKTLNPFIVKLSPNVTDIVEIAKAAEEAGADGISLINTILAMKIDVKTKKPILANNYGGLSGAAVKPVAVRMVHQVASAVSIPVIGMGGIMTGEDVAEFMLAGASGVMVGTASLITPDAPTRILHEFEKYCSENKVENMAEIIGGVVLN